MTTAPAMDLGLTIRQAAVLEALETAPGPLSVVEALEHAAEIVPGLGIATVYRAVKRLEELGVLRPVELPGEDARYEPSSRGHHHHFHCRGCGRVFDVDGCPLHAAAAATVPGGFLLEDHEITLYGLCPACDPAEAAAG